MSWEERSFDELGFIGRGKSRHRPRNDESLYGGKYPMIQTGEVKAANFYINQFKTTYNEKGLAQSKLWNKNTLCITIAANIAETAILDIEACFPDSIIGFIADEDKCDVRFIKYFFDVYKVGMQRVSQGATQDNLSLQKLLTFKVPTPPLPTQKKIASILSAYDDLIENNLKRIQLLEEAAQRLYKEWFVDFKFPNHENTPINPETGLPDGWERKNYGSLLKKVIRKGKLKKSDYKIKGDYPVIDQGDGFIAGYSNNSEIIQNENLPLVIFGDHTRRVKFIDFPFICGADGTQLLSPKDESYLPSFFYHLTNHIDLSNYAYARHFKFLKEHEVIIPENYLIEEFNKKTNSILNQINRLRFYNQNLKEARDLLLPRLMNRTIEV